MKKNGESTQGFPEPVPTTVAHFSIKCWHIRLPLCALGSLERFLLYHNLVSKAMSHTLKTWTRVLLLFPVLLLAKQESRDLVCPFASLAEMGVLFLQLRTIEHLFPSHALLEGSRAVVYSSVFLSHVTHSFQCYMKSHMPDAPGGQRTATAGQMCSLFLGSASDSVPGLGGFG